MKIQFVNWDHYIRYEILHQRIQYMTVHDCEPKLNQPPSWPHAAPPPHPSEVAEPFLSVLWIGIAHLSSTSWTMRGSEQLNAEVEVCACVCACVRVCVWGKEWGVWWGTKAKREILCYHSTWGLFFQVPVGCICHVLLSCHHSPPAPEIPEHFLKPSSVLLHFLGLPPFRWPHPLCSTSERKPKKHCSSNSLSQTQPSVLHPPSSCSSVLHLELVSHSLSRSHTQYLKKMMYHLWIKQIIKRHLTLLPLVD